MNVDVGRLGCSEGPLTGITGESYEINRLQRSCVLEWSPGGCCGIQASSILSELGEEGRVVKIDRSRSLRMFETEEGFRMALALDGSWWTNWSPDLRLLPFHEVVTVDFGSLESGALVDGQILLLTNRDEGSGVPSPMLDPRRASMEHRSLTVLDHGVLHRAGVPHGGGAASDGDGELRRSPGMDV
ncbi:hypothetical protein Dimus_010198 [Dionaea muscipula]